MKTILITGGAGFIGSHLCRRLIKKNKIICVDSLITGTKKNIKDLLKLSNFLFIKQDIIKPIKIKTKIDEIYDLACPATPAVLEKLAIEILLTNSLGVKNLLDLAVKNKAKFLHASTSEVYGNPLEHPQKETYWGHVNPIGVRSCYDEGKRFAESLIINYRKKYGLDAKIIRIFNTYGPNMRPEDGRVMSNFITQALAGKKLTIYGSGQQTRSFCYVSDLIEGIVKMMASREAGPINLGNPKEEKIIDLAKKIILLTRSRSKISFLPPASDDPVRRKPDINLARERLGWQPKVSLRTGLGSMIRYYQEIL